MNSKIKRLEVIKLRKILKNIIFIVSAFFAGIAILFSIAWASLQTDFMQTNAVNFFGSILSSSLKSKVTVGSVSIGFFNKIILEDVKIYSNKNEKIASLKKLKASLRSFSYKYKTAEIGRIYLDEAVFGIRQQRNGNTNIDEWLEGTSAKDTSSSKWKFTINSVQFKNLEFSYIHEGVSVPVDVFDYENTNVQNISGLIENIKLTNSFITCSIEALAFKERCGFTMQSFSGQFIVSNNSINFNNFTFKTDKSDVSIRMGHFGYKNFLSFKEFLTEVHMDCKVEKSQVSMADISYFTGELKGLNQMVDAKGWFKGTVSDFTVTNACISLLDSTKFEGKVEISGLPDIQNTYFFIDAKRLKTSMSDIAAIPLYPFTSGEKVPIDPSLKKIGSIRYSGNFTGFIYDVVAFGKISTSLGNVTSDILIKQLKKEKEIKLSGNFATERFNLGSFLGSASKVGKVDMSVKINTTFNDDGFKMSDLDGAIAAIDFNNYAYKNISFDGVFTPKAFNGKAAIKDQNLDMSFLGKCDLSQKLPIFDFDAHVGHLNFHRLNVLKGDSVADISFNLHTKLTGNKIENVNGVISVDSILFENKKGQTFINNAQLEIVNKQSQIDLKLQSDIVNARFYGNFTFDNLVNNVNKTIAFYLPSLLGETKKEETENDEKLSFSITIKDLSELSKTLFPAIVLKKPVLITGQYLSKYHFLKVHSSAQVLEFGTTVLSDFTFDMYNENSALLYKTNFNLPVFNVGFKNISAKGKIQHDSISLACNWLKNDTVLYRGNVNTVGVITRTVTSNSPNILFTISPTEIVVADSIWNLGKSTVSIDSCISIMGFTFRNNDQILRIEGNISENPQDSLTLVLSNFELKYFNKFIKDKSFGFQGKVSGYLSLFEISNNFHFRSRINATGFQFAETDYGTLYAISEWDEGNKSVAINVYTERGLVKPIVLKGFYFPEDNIVDFSLNVNNANLSLISVFVKDFFTDIKGYIVGEVRIQGKLNKPEMHGYLELKKASLFVDYLKTSYNLSGRCNVINQKIQFDNVQVFDVEGNNATANGDLQFPNFSTVTYDIIVDSKNFLALDTKLADNEYFYGKAYATGVTKIYGDLNQTQIDVSAKSNPNTIINIPISNQTTIEENKFLTFKTKTVKTKKVEESSFDGITMNFDLEVTPDAEIQLILDEKVGDIIRSKGYGTIQMNIDTKGKFNMYGTYEILTGDYLFTMRNLINKKFTIEPGSKLVWTGSAFDANAEIVAKYKLKTNLLPLMIQTQMDNNDSTIYNKRIPIECKISLTDKILKPNIAFSVDMKDANEKAKQVYSNLSEDDKNKQFMSLLVLNSFFSFNTNNTAQTTSSYKSSGTEMVTSQLSNLLSNINKDINVGVNYRYGSPTAKLNDEVELAISTELLNNRVVVNVNGYSQVKTANSTTTTDNSSLGGDVNIEVKLNKKGTLRAKGFTRTNNDNLNYEKKGDTQGVGLSYSQNFNSFGDLFVGNKRKKIVEEQKKQ